MANFQAIHAVCEGVVKQLQHSWQSALFNDQPLQFEVYGPTNFENPMTTGVSLFLYHVCINQNRRSIPVGPHPITHLPRRPQLPVDLHFMMTPWAQSPSLAHEILGWTMRILEDMPKLGAQALNNIVANVAFTEDEAVEIVPGHITMEEIFRIWDVLPGNFRLSVPYVARIVRIDSLGEEQGDGIVTIRDLNFGKLLTQ